MAQGVIAALVGGAGRVSVWKLLQSCHALRNEMAHLCGQLQAYLMFEVLERAWVELTEKLASVTHLDDLIGNPWLHTPLMVRYLFMATLCLCFGIQSKCRL